MAAPAGAILPGKARRCCVFRNPLLSSYPAASIYVGCEAYDSRCSAILALSSWLVAPGHHTTIDIQDRASNPACLVREQKVYCIGDIVDTTDTT